MRPAKRKNHSKSNPERKRWRKLRDLLIDVFGTVNQASCQVGCHASAFRKLDACPDVRKKLETALAKRGEVLP